MNITPEKAYALRDNATPGPWRTDEHPYMDGQSVYQAEGLKVAQHLSGYNADLVVAAPALAEVVANLHYEYALQVEVEPGLWQFIHQGGEPTGWETSAAWARREQVAAEQRVVERYRDNPRRVVRRLVSEPVENPEVVE